MNKFSIDDLARMGIEYDWDEVVKIIRRRKNERIPLADIADEVGVSATTNSKVHTNHSSSIKNDILAKFQKYMYRMGIIDSLYDFRFFRWIYIDTGNPVTNFSDVDFDEVKRLVLNSLGDDELRKLIRFLQDYLGDESA